LAKVLTNATLITEGTAVQGSIATEEDRDVFTVRASSAKTRVILRKRFSAAMDVYDYAEKLVTSGSAHEDRTVTLSFESTQGAIYYLVVKSSIGAMKPLGWLYHGDYQLTVRPE
jgi:hypothetical protein